MLKRCSIVVCFLLCLINSERLLAQHSLLLSYPHSLFSDGLELYEKQKYAAAQKAFLDYLKADSESERATHAKYYAIACAMHLGNADFEQKMLDFIAAYPVHPQTRQAYQDLGYYYFDKGDFPKAIEYLSEAVVSRPTTPDEIETTYKLAYSYFQQKKYQRAKPLFDRIKKDEHPYQYYALYYAGYLAYLDEDYDNALIDLEKASEHPTLKKETSLLIPTIYYKRNECHRVLEFINQLKKEKQPFPAENYLLIGDCYYNKSKYVEAAENFRNYASQTQKAINRDISYRIGYSCFWANDFSCAVNHFNSAAFGQDSLAQIAAYYLGVSFMKLYKPLEALNAFNIARRLSKVKEIAELAAFYYIQISYAEQDFRTSLEGCDFFMENFSDTAEEERLENVRKIQIQSHLYSGDYKKALKILQNLKDKNYEIQKAYQQIAYNMGVLSWNDGDYAEAKRFFLLSKQYAVEDSIVVKAQFAMAEIYSLQEKYDSALYFYQKTEKKLGKSPQWKYGMAYALYNVSRADAKEKLNDYQRASKYFYDYILESRSDHPKRIVDVFVRLADCYQVMQKYDEALRYYDLAINNDYTFIDYVLLQKAAIMKAKKQINEAIVLLNQVLEMDKEKTVYRQEAMLKKGEIYFEEGRKQKAIETFTQLIDEYPKGSLKLKAYLRRALAFQPDNYQKAISDYEQILDLDISSSEAKEAIKSLKEFSENNIYSSERFEEYFNKYSKVNPDDEDTIGYIFKRAKKPFEEERYEEAIKSLNRFLAEYPTDNPYLDETNYLLGYCHELIGKKEEAIQFYEKIQKSSSFYEKTVRAMADIFFSLEEYQKALVYYNQLAKIATNRRNKEIALLGLMRTLFELDDFDGTIQKAEEIILLDLKKSLNEAKLYIAKVYLEEKKYDDALVKLFEIVSKSS
ncbi:MAG: tetratricopeptide repeat protein, partial [Flammeovirgaceae bacterium]|nr:tetratricopeptide repeat protein [Flammeovirgaceae bacterium]MDW8287331.1 tetratricopeptide repeat protein [Flammeovirgaceae bacterium]